MNLREGAILQGGKYRIERELGHGGFGITYLATQVGLNRRVAIKEFFMSEYCNRDADTSHVSVPSEGSKELVAKFRTKFIKEAQTIAEMDNHHIIRIHDVFEDNGTAYYVMEYLPGGDLRSRIPSGGMPEAEAVGYIREVADALRYIHAKNILHLDIKPTNILFRGSGEAVLIDFGISKHYDDAGGGQTSSTPVGISEGYAPTEQYEREGVSSFSASTDIYALGATLYCLLSGSRPPKASIVLNDGLPELPSRVSEATRTAVEQAMQPRRKDRPQSVEEFMALLEAEVDEVTVIDINDNVDVNVNKKKNKHENLEHPEGGSTSTLKKYLLPAVACVVVALAVVFWPKGGDAPVKEEERQEILPPAGRQNDTNQQQTSQQQSAPVKEEPAAPTTTELYVTTTPSDATVYVDGKKVGTTPIEGKEIARGSHKVKLSKEGYEDKTLTRTFGDKPVTLNETLTKKPVVLTAQQNYAIGKDYYHGRNGKVKNYAEAVKYFRKAAEQGYAEAQFSLGSCYYDGQGVAQDYGEAVKWYRKAAEQGYAKAQSCLGFCYDFGQGVAQDYGEAVKWYRKAAEQGDATGQNCLGACYYDGQGVAQDYGEAVKWYRKAAEQGDDAAQYNLGLCYYYDHGVTQDYALAVEWFRKAAEQGYAKGQYYLGLCYDKGQGVAQDYALAVEWFRKAAEQGDADGQFFLGLSYKNGYGVAQDSVEAVKWCYKAALQGHFDARRALRYWEVNASIEELNELVGVKSDKANPEFEMK